MNAQDDHRERAINSLNEAKMATDEQEKIQGSSHESLYILCSEQQNASLLKKLAIAG